MPRAAPCLAAIALAWATAAVADDRWIDDHLGGLVALYRHLHSHPELSLHEFATARRLADELAEAGAEVTAGVGGTGVVGLLRNGPGPTVLVRADLDALPVVEATGLPFASIVKARDDEGNEVGVMHACGHDLHMANLVGTARWLADHRDRWSGTVVLVGQPAEERALGAVHMLADGLYARFPRPDFALALHVADDLEAGRVGYRAGPAMAGSTSLDVVVKGKGGHGAGPHQAVDPVVLAAELILDVQTIVSRDLDPNEPAVVSVGQVHGGDRPNVIPGEVHLGLTLRAFSDPVRDRLIAGIERRAAALARSHRAPSPTVEPGGGVPPVFNTPGLVAAVVPALRRALGEASVVAIDPTMLAEDFGLFGEGGVPTFLFRLGTVEPRRLERSRATRTPPPSLHSSLYHPDAAPALRAGIRAMSAAVVALLPPRAGS